MVSRYTHFRVLLPVYHVRFLGHKFAGLPRGFPDASSEGNSGTTN
jgi:hypothetical protein